MKKEVLSTISFSVCYVIFIVAIHKIPIYLLFEQMGHNKVDSELIDKIILNGVVIALTILIIKRENLSPVSGIAISTMRKPHLYLITVLYLIVFTNGFRSFRLISSQESVLTFTVIIFLIKSLSVGFFEEIVFRSLIQSLILRKFHSINIKTSFGLLVSSLIFGLAHLINLNSENYTFFGVISQIFAATCLGYLFGVILLITKNIYPIIFIHSLISFFSLFGSLYPNYFPEKQAILEQSLTSTFFSILFTILLFGSALLIAIHLIRKYKI